MHLSSLPGTILLAKWSSCRARRSREPKRAALGFDAEFRQRQRNERLGPAVSGKRSHGDLRAFQCVWRVGVWQVRRGAFPESDLWSEGWGRAGHGQPISDPVRGNDAKRLDRNRIVGTGKRLEEMVVGIISRQEESPQRLAPLLSTRTRALQGASTLKKRFAVKR